MWCEHGCKPEKTKIGNVTTIGCAHLAIATMPVEKKEDPSMLFLAAMVAFGLWYDLKRLLGFHVPDGAMDLKYAVQTIKTRIERNKDMSTKTLISILIIVGFSVLLMTVSLQVRLANKVQGIESYIGIEQKTIYVEKSDDSN